MAKKVTEETNTVVIELPLANLPGAEGYEIDQIEFGELSFSGRINVKLPSHLAKVFLRLRQGFRETNARFPDGKPIWTNTETLQALLEKLLETK